jgi:rare lipoprotein A
MVRGKLIQGGLTLALMGTFALPASAGRCDLKGPMPKEAGYASWYGKDHRGRRTANGQRFNEKFLTAAHATLPLNSEIDVTNLLNGRTVKVMITDRLGAATLDVDLSASAAQRLDMQGCGVVPVLIRPSRPDLLAMRP